MQEKDVNGKVIFADSLLCSQFLRDNFDIPLLQDIRPEDIEDVTAKYQTFLGNEYRADSVKRIKMRMPRQQTKVHEQLSSKEDDSKAVLPQTDSIYLVSLVEHKSSVDYDVAMQLLKYMVCIWTQYAKDMEELQRGSTMGRISGIRLSFPSYTMKEERSGQQI